MPQFPDIGDGSEVLTETEAKLEKPKLYKVLLHNDDFTTMEFVVFVLEYVFNRSEAEAFTVMLKRDWLRLDAAWVFEQTFQNKLSDFILGRIAIYFDE